MPAEPQVYISYYFVNESAIALGTRVKITTTPTTTTPDAARNWVTYTTLPPYTPGQEVYGSIGQLTLNTKYFVRFLPYNAVNEAALFYPDLIIHSKPAAPTLVSPTVSDTTISVNWSSAADPVSGGFKIRYRRTDVTPVAWTEVLVTTTSARTYTIANLSNATSYTIEVSSYNQNDGYIEESAAFSTVVTTASGYSSTIVAQQPIHYYRLNDLGSDPAWGIDDYTGDDSGVGSSITGYAPFSTLPLAKDQFGVNYSTETPGLLLGRTSDDESIELYNNGTIRNGNNSEGNWQRRVYFNQPGNVGKATLMFIYQSAIVPNCVNTLFKLDGFRDHGGTGGSVGSIELVETMDASSLFKLKLNIQDDDSPFPHYPFANSPESVPSPATGAKAHVAIVIEPGSQKVYLNGVVVASSNIVSTEILQSLIGYIYTSSAQPRESGPTSGAFFIDEVSIFNKVLSAPQIQGFKQAALG